MPNADELNLSSSTAHPLALYRNHLEFNGYKVEEVDDELICRHSRKPNLIIRPISDRGVLVSTIYTFEAELGRLDILEYINDLNADFVFMKAFIDDDNSLIIETFFEGDYDRTNFSILLDNVEYDIGILYQHELTQGYLQ